MAVKKFIMLKIVVVFLQQWPERHFCKLVRNSLTLVLGQRAILFVLISVYNLMEQLVFPVWVFQATYSFCFCFFFKLTNDAFHH